MPGNNAYTKTHYIIRRQNSGPEDLINVKTLTALFVMDRKINTLSYVKFKNKIKFKKIKTKKKKKEKRK